MTDSSWENSGQPAKRPGMPTWVKVLMGCGVTALLLFGGCTALATWGCHAMTHNMESAEWSQLRSAAVQLQTAEGTRALYAANPGLAVQYPTEAEFTRAAEAWRPRLEALPAQMPGLFTGRINYTLNVQGGFRKVELGYRNGKGAMLSSRWENGHLMQIELR